MRLRASVFGAAAVLGLGVASAVAAGPSRMGAPLIATGTNPSTAIVPPRAALVSRSTAGSVLTLTIACRNGSAGGVCSGPITLTANGGQKIGSGSYSVATGKQTTATVPLDSAGLSLLAKSYKLAATVSLAGTTALTRNVHFHYPKIDAPISFTWAFSVSSTVAQALSVSGVPAGGTVEVTCHGGGCPFADRSFSPGGGTVNLEPSLAGAGLHPHSMLEIEITAGDEVGKVATFTFESGAQPTLAEACLLPGATRPTRCA